LIHDGLERLETAARGEGRATVNRINNSQMSARFHALGAARNRGVAV
jgi:hypothetical protein